MVHDADVLDFVLSWLQVTSGVTGDGSPDATPAHSTATRSSPSASHTSVPGGAPPGLNTSSRLPSLSVDSAPSLPDAWSMPAVAAGPNDATNPAVMLAGKEPDPLSSMWNRNTCTQRTPVATPDSYPKVLSCAAARI